MWTDAQTLCTADRLSEHCALEMVLPTFQRRRSNCSLVSLKLASNWASSNCSSWTMQWYSSTDCVMHPHLPCSMAVTAGTSSYKVWGQTSSRWFSRWKIRALDPHAPYFSHCTSSLSQRSLASCLHFSARKNALFLMSYSEAIGAYVILKIITNNSFCKLLFNLNQKQICFEDDEHYNTNMTRHHTLLWLFWPCLPKWNLIWTKRFQWININTLIMQ